MKKNLMIIVCAMAATLTGTAVAQTPSAWPMEPLTRGVVAIPNGTRTFVSWRLLGTDDPSTLFDLLRDRKPVATNLRATNYTDARGTAESKYQVVTKVGGTPVDTTAAVTRWDDIFMQVHLDRPASQPGYHYFPNDCSAADVDGDGEYELLVKWDPSNTQDNSVAGRTGNVYLDCYRLSGEKLWRVDLGQNIRAGAHYTQFLFYDFDGDGHAELICKTAPGSKDSEGRYVTEAADDAAIKNATDNATAYANSQGRILRGPEYLTVFDGQTGRAVHTVWYNPNRGFGVGSSASYSATWGDDWGNRGDRFLAGVAYLDGADERPSAVMCRGYYTRVYVWAVDFDGQKLSTKWLHAATSSTKVSVTDADGKTTSRTYSSNTSGESRLYTSYAMGCHSLTVGDVDGDGCDEIIYGSAAIDNDGWLLHTTGLGHGDALHLGDFMPDRPGLEIMMVHEEAPYGFSVRDALTGELLVYVKGSDDTGRGIAADIDPAYRGHEYWNSDTQQIYNNDGVAYKDVPDKTRPFYNFRIYWDGDEYDDLFDRGAINDGKWNRLLSASNYGNSTTYGSKATPQLQADLFGDWREEVVLFNSEDSCTLNIFSTTTATKYRVPTLMHDHNYRLAVAWQNVGYNQPPHLSFYLPDYVATRFEPVGESTKEQNVVLGDSMQTVSFRMVNCTGVTFLRATLNGATLRSYAAPDGFTFTVDRIAGIFTLAGLPSEKGIYEFIVRSTGDDTGTNVNDTIRVVVEEPMGISAAELLSDGVEPGRHQVYDLSGKRVSTANMRPGIYMVRRGNRYTKVIVK